MILEDPGRISVYGFEISFQDVYLRLDFTFDNIVITFNTLPPV